MAVVVKADNFEHGAASHPLATLGFFGYPAGGAPELGAAYAKNGSYGVRCGRGDINEDVWYTPVGSSADAGTRTTTEGWFKPVQHDTQDEVVYIMHDLGFASVALAIHLVFISKAGPTYHLQHPAGTDVLTLTLGDWYRFRRHCYADGSKLHSWLWVWNAADTLLVDADYTTATTIYASKIYHLFGTDMIEDHEATADIYYDDLVCASDIYWDTTPTITILTPNADDDTEDDFGVTTPPGEPSAGCVDEVPPDPLEYAHTSTDEHKQLWETDAALGADADIQGVALGHVLRTAFVSGNPVCVPRIKDGVTVAEGTGKKPTAGIAVANVAWWMTAPSGGAWTTAKVNDLLVGARFDTAGGFGQVRVVQALAYALRFDSVTPPAVVGITENVITRVGAATPIGLSVGVC